MNNTKLFYPIELYIKKSLLILTLILCLVIFVICVWVGSLILNGSWLDFIASLFLLITVVAVGISIIIALIKNKPSIIIYPSKIELAYFNKQNQQILWSEIENIELIEHFGNRGGKFWKLAIYLKQSHDKPINYPLRIMTHDDLILNEKEIFAIIEQSLQGKPPVYQKINISLKEQSGTIFDYWFYILVFGGGSIMALFFGFIKPTLELLLP